MSNEVNDNHREIIHDALSTIIGNYAWLRDHIAKYELETFVQEPEKKYLNKLEKALKEYKKDVGNMEQG